MKKMKNKCFNNYSSSPEAYVVAGTYDSCAKTESSRHIYNIIRSMKHEKSEQFQVWYDIGLLRLDRDVHNYDIVCLPPNSRKVTNSNSLLYFRYLTYFFKFKIRCKTS